MLPHLFEAMRRGDHSHVVAGSIGLGLFIVKQVVAAHGGTIEVTSGDGQGTTFMVKLPRLARQAAADAVTSTREVPVHCH
jgi:signal transduction histidine kinase